MIAIYLPTNDRPLWPCLVLLLVFIPVSVWHEAGWRRTLAEYAGVRRRAGATDEQWPSAELRWEMGVQPWLIAVSAVLLAAMVALGAIASLRWPQKLAYFDEVLNYYDRPYLAAMLVAGAAAVIGGGALALDLARSPYSGVASRLRRAVHASRGKRQECFSAALKVDPGVPAA